MTRTQYPGCAPDAVPVGSANWRAGSAVEPAAAPTGPCHRVSLVVVSVMWLEGFPLRGLYGPDSAPRRSQAASRGRSVILRCISASASSANASNTTARRVIVPNPAPRVDERRQH